LNGSPPNTQTLGNRQLDIKSVIETHVQTIKNDSPQATPGLVMEAIHSFWQSRPVDDTRLSGWDFYKNLQLDFEPLENEERDQVIREIEREINEGLFKKSGPHRLSDWNSGWGENLDSLMASSGGDLKQTLSPKYFRKYDYERLGGVHVKVAPENGIEIKLLGFIVDALTEHLARNFKVTELWEFGCGTGHHLMRIRNFLPDIRLVGLDWAESSQLILQEASIRLKDSELVGRNFDYFKPDFAIKPENKESHTLFLTVASLEQIGKKHDQFLEYLLSVRPSVVLHIEPIEELLGDSAEEYLSKKYFQTRNYLSGYLDALRDLEKKGKISIMSAERTGLGSYFIEGYSVVAWRPV